MPAGDAPLNYHKGTTITRMAQSLSSRGIFLQSFPNLLNFAIETNNSSHLMISSRSAPANCPVSFASFANEVNTNLLLWLKVGLYSPSDSSNISRLTAIRRYEAALQVAGETGSSALRWNFIYSKETIIFDKTCSSEQGSSGSLYLLACRICQRQSNTSTDDGSANSLCNFCSKSGITIFFASLADSDMCSSSSVMNLASICAMAGKWERCANLASMSGQALMYSSSAPSRFLKTTCKVFAMQFTQFSSRSSPIRYSSTLPSHLYLSLSEGVSSLSSFSISSAISDSSSVWLCGVVIGSSQSATASWSEVSISAAMNVRFFICGLALWCMGHLSPSVMSRSAKDSFLLQCSMNTRIYSRIFPWMPAMLSTYYTQRSSRLRTSPKVNPSNSVSSCPGIIKQTIQACPLPLPPFPGERTNLVEVQHQCVSKYLVGLLVMKGGEAVYHTVLDSQRSAFTNHVNEVLKDDKDIKNRLPIHEKEIFEAVGDGVILCKLINSAVFGKVPPISPAAINLHCSNVYHKIENLNLSIESARSIGCTVINITPTLIMEKRQHIILGLIWQIIKIYITNKISLKQYPEIILLRREDEPDDIMNKLGYEEILVRWVNYHIRRNGGDKLIKNVGADMADGYGYGHVLKNVAPSLPANYFDLDKDARAVKAIETCKNEGIHPPIKPSDITSGNPRLNTLLLAEIFNTRHGLIIEQQKIIELPPEPETDESREIRVFKNWINSQGIEQVYVNYLIDDLRTGTILLKVIDRLRPNLVDWKKHSNKSTSRIHIIQNCNYVVDICRDQLQAKLVGIGGVDIVDGKTTLVLGLVWQICKLYWIQRLGVINEEKLLGWANERVPEQHRVKNFKDKSLRNCQFLLHLIDTIRPNIVDYSKVPAGDSEQEQIAKINYTIALARKLGCQIIALWEHVNEANARYVSLFVAELEYNFRKGLK